MLKAEFPTAQAVIAGQGQTVRVVGRADRRHRRRQAQGRQRDRRGWSSTREYKGMVRTDATRAAAAQDRPEGHVHRARAGHATARRRPRTDWTIPIAATAPDVNPDEILAELDSDTRDYLQAADLRRRPRASTGRGGDLRDLLRRFEPTHRDLARVNGAVAERRTNLRRLITSLNQLNGELASRGDDLAGLVDLLLRGDARVRLRGAERVRRRQRAARARCSRRRTRWRGSQRYATLLGPTAEKLRPAARALDPANQAVAPLAKEATPLLRNDIRPFVREARPLARDLRPAAAQTSPPPRRRSRASFTQLNNFLNLLAYNPNGREDPGNADRQEGYLFWLGVGRSTWRPSCSRPRTPTACSARSRSRAPCATIEQIVNEQPAARVPGDADPDPHRLPGLRMT